MRKSTSYTQHITSSGYGADTLIEQAVHEDVLHAGGYGLAVAVRAIGMAASLHPPHNAALPVYRADTSCIPETHV